MPDRDGEFRTENVRGVCRIVRSTLGPFGTNKLLVEADGTVTVTASAATLLDRLAVDDPGVELLRTAAADFRERTGDGAGTVVTLAGALVEAAERLGEQGVHPTVVDRGFRAALPVAVAALDRRATPCEGLAPAVAETALTGVEDPGVRERMGSVVADAADRVRERADGPVDLGRDVAVVARLGGARAETGLVEGVVIDDDPVADGMPRSLADAGVAVLSSTVDVAGLGTATGRRDLGSVTVRADSYEDRAAIGDAERESFRRTLAAATDAGCRCLVTSGSVNDRVKTTLASEGVLALHQLDRETVGRIARSTGATVVPDLAHVTEATLGRADVEVSRRAGREMTTVRGAAGGVYTLFCRAPDPRSTDAFERSVRDAVAAVGMARDGGVVPGGGAAELAAARRVAAAARERTDREQLAMLAFADALETVPRALARNAGLDANDALARMRAGEAGVLGVDAPVAEVVDAEAAGILDPLPLKRRAFEVATEVAVQFARIDGVLSATDLGGDDSGADRTGAADD